MLNKLKVWLNERKEKRKESKKQRLNENARYEADIQQYEEKAEAGKYVHLNGDEIRNLISEATDIYRNLSGRNATKTARELRIMLEAMDLIDEREYRLKRISTIANAPVVKISVKKAA